MGKYIIQVAKKAQIEIESIYKSGNKATINKIETIFKELSSNPYLGTGNP
jgi:toxin YoeB